MNNKITMCDYSTDWALNENFLDERASPGYLTREEVIRFFGTLGINAVELFHAYWQDSSIGYVKNVCADASLPICSYSIFVDLLGETPARRKQAIDETKRLLDRTADLGAGLCMIVPAVIKQNIPLAEQRSWMVESLRECAEHGHSIGITLACENLDYPPARPLLGTGKDCRDVCVDVDHPGFKLIFDCCASLFLDENPLDTLRAVQPFMVHVHLKNSRIPYQGENPSRYRDAVSGKRFTGTVLDGGLVPIPVIIAELAKIGYSGYLQIEYQGECDPRNALAYSLEYARKMMECSG
ncbi:MAG: TIM barrel protein [Armatimonadetes bacterium]|nr:TIM barrel protein [Armatimonadota bacterium]